VIELKQYVIIGNSAAAVGAIEGIRKNDKEGNIIVLSKEKHHTYSRPLISYLLLGKTDLERMVYRPKTFYKENNCEVLLGETVRSIDIKKKIVHTESDKAILYDEVLVATGSTPFVPPMQGLEKVEKKFCFGCLDDALLLEKELGKDKKVLIVGAGLIGLKCAEGIYAKVESITVLDLAPKVLSSILDEEASKKMQAHLEKKGLHFILGDSVKEFTEKEAILVSGKIVPYDIVVTAVGVRANTQLVNECGGTCNRGIVINNKCETSIKNIYAAGDCAEAIDVVSGEQKVMALLPNAYMQGLCAGENMAGGTEDFSGAMLMNSIGLMGLHIMTAGIYDGEVYEENKEDSYKKLFYKENRLVGFILLGDIEKVGIYTALIRNKTPLDTIDFGLICKNPSLMAFSREDRADRLGGEQ